MTIRDRLAWRYAAIFVVCLILLGTLCYHEFVTEPRWFQEAAARGEVKHQGDGFLEVSIYALLPVVMGAGWWLMRRSLAPLDALARGVERIQACNLREPLPRTFNADEVDRLTEVFNAMTARLDRSFQNIREFTLHASHELKTPLTLMRAQLQTALQEPATTAPEQREWMGTQIDEIDRLTKIVNGLALLAQADAGQLTVERKPVRLQKLVREGHEDALVLALAQNLQVTLEVDSDPVVVGDRDRLRQLVLNLTDNAVKHNRPGGSVALSLRRVNDRAEIQITNTGAVLSPEIQARAFQPFVRGNEARRQAIDGCGLGLAIAQSIVQAHGGTIQLASQPDGQTTVIVRLPLAENAGNSAG